MPRRFTSSTNKTTRIYKSNRKKMMKFILAAKRNRRKDNINNTISSSFDSLWRWVFLCLEDFHYRTSSLETGWNDWMEKNLNEWEDYDYLLFNQIKAEIYKVNEILIHFDLRWRSVIVCFEAVLCLFCRDNYLPCSAVITSRLLVDTIY